MPGHWVWWMLTMACVVWYATVTVYVAVRGAIDIRNMLRRLKSQTTEETQPARGEVHETR